MSDCAESVRVARPLFQGERGGSTPTSALQLWVDRCPIKDAATLNLAWHSRLPRLGNWRLCFAYAAEFEGIRYAVAIWSHPVARLLNGRGMLELRRMAIAPDAPKNTASRMLAVMARLISRDLPDVNTLISYQDTSVHAGTIYRAAGWEASPVVRGVPWNMPGRYRSDGPASGTSKVRWSKSIRASPIPDPPRPVDLDVAVRTEEPDDREPPPVPVATTSVAKAIRLEPMELFRWS